MYELLNTFTLWSHRQPSWRTWRHYDSLAARITTSTLRTYTAN